MKMRSACLGLIIIMTSACKSLGAHPPAGSAVAGAATEACEIVIVGGGVGGLHTAYRLGPEFGAKVCVFEKEARLGGRIYDIAKSPDQLNGPFIAVGGRRVMDGQSVLLQLAKELNISLEKPPIVKELAYARGMYAIDKDDFIKVYPTLDVDKNAGGYEEQLYNRLLKGPERARVEQYANLQAYVLAVVGKEGYNFLHDTYRFRADYEYDLSAKAYLEYLDEENNTGAICPSGGCQTLYPVGGMSAFVRALEQKSRAFGVQIFTSEPVLAIDHGKTGYLLKTSRRAIHAKKVIIAVPPVALSKISGTILQAITAQPQFKALVGVRVTTIAQWYDEPWWQGIVTKDGVPVWRAWTNDHCINSIEIPQEEYAKKQNVIRTVYNDKLVCVEKWAALAKGPPAAMEAEINKGLTQLFHANNLTKPVKIGKPTKTVYWEWPDAWYFIRGGTKLSNRDIFDWAVEPLPGEDIGLVSEGYNPQRSAWTDGAYKSSINYLNKKFAMKLAGLER